MSTLIIMKKCDNTLLEVSKELAERGETLTFLSKTRVENISSLGKFGTLYNLYGDSAETATGYNGWVELIEESDRIIVWG